MIANDSKRRAERTWWRRALSPWLVAMLVLSLDARAQPDPAKVVIACDEESGTYSMTMARLLYAQLSKRLGIHFEVVAFPMMRRSAMADSGAVDGETARVASYAEEHPHQLRVQEPLAFLGFDLYTTRPSLSIKSLGELSGTKVRAEYRRGVLFCERALKSVFPEERVSTVTNVSEGLKKLIAGRTDVYCDIESAAAGALHDTHIERIQTVRKLLHLGTVPTYPFLHKRNAELAVRMAPVLKQMREEGLLDACVRQAQRQMGWLPPANECLP